MELRQGVLAGWAESRGPGSRCRAVGRGDQPFGQKLGHEAIHVLPGANGVDRVAPGQQIGHLGDAASLLEPGPDVGSAPGGAVVGACAEVHDDDLSVEGLGGDLLAANREALVRCVHG